MARQLATDDYVLKQSNPSKLVEIVKAISDRWLVKRY